ncbi:MAG: O-antigen ligase family protein [Bacillota bacterium]
MAKKKSNKRDIPPLSTAAKPAITKTPRGTNPTTNSVTRKTNLKPGSGKETTIVRAAARVLAPAEPTSARPLSFLIAFWGLATLLFYSPFARGLFFPEDQYRALILIAIVFWFVWLGKQALQEHKFFEHPLDYLMLGLPLVYIYSAFFAVNTGYAVNEIARNTMYFLAFWVAARVVTTAADAIRLFHVIWFSAILVALAGLATATGIIEIKDGFLGGRIYSSFQYPNALATYLSAVFLLGFYLWNRAVEEGPTLREKGSPFHKAPKWLQTLNPYPYYYVVGNLLLFAVFLGTKSQGGFLIFALVFPLFLVKLRPEVRLRAVIHTLLVALPALLTINRFLDSVAAGKNDLAWVWVIVGLLLVSVGQVLIDFVSKKGYLTGGDRGDVFLKALGGLAGLAAVIGVIVVSTSAALQERLSELIKWHNAEHRFAFMGDAWDMIVLRPFTGWGGGGWKEAYQAFQSYLYTSREVHGHYFQVGVETGIIGVLILVGIWAAFLWTAHRLFHALETTQRVKDLTWVVTIAVILIGLHAAIDFDLSLSALTLVLFALFGTVVGLSRLTGEVTDESKRTKRKNSSYVPPNYTRFVVASVGALVIVAFAACLSASHAALGQAVGLLQAGNFKQGIAELKRAEAYNPANGDIHLLMAQAYNQGLNDQDAAFTEVEKALARSQYNPAGYTQKAQILVGLQEFEAAVATAEQAVTVAPLRYANYEQLSQVMFTGGFSLMQDDALDEAKEYLKQVIQVPSRMETRMSTVDETKLKYWKGPQLVPGRRMMVTLGSAHYMLGDFDAALPYLEEAAADESVKAEAILWQALLRDKQGDDEAVRELLSQLEEADPELAAAFEAWKQLPLPVE